MVERASSLEALQRDLHLDASVYPHSPLPCAPNAMPKQFRSCQGRLAQPFRIHIRELSTNRVLQPSEQNKSLCTGVRDYSCSFHPSICLSWFRHNRIAGGVAPLDEIASGHSRPKGNTSSWSHMHSAS